MELNLKDLFDLSNIGSLSSIVGLIVTLVTLYKVRKIQSYFLYKARVPALQEQLRQHAKVISNYQSQSIEPSEVRRQLALCNVTLESLQRKVEGDLKKGISKLRETIRGTIVNLVNFENIDIGKQEQLRQQINYIYSEIHVTDAKLEDLTKDLEFKT